MYRPKRQLVVHAEGLVLRFFNFWGSQLKQFQAAAQTGRYVRAYGEVKRGFFGAEMAHPRYRIVDAGEPLPQALTPIYPTTAGLSQAELRAQVLAALDAGPIDDPLPASVYRSLDLAGFAESVSALHRPQPGSDLTAAWRRVRFDELLAQQLSMRFAYRRRRSRQAPVLKVNGPLLQTFIGGLPFKLTAAQTRAMQRVLDDVGQPHPMQRLLQGDVGSGKTIVAAIACLAAVDAGAQAAVMAPTEILAEQHHRKFSAWLAPLGVQIAWLHGALPAAERKRARAAIASGEAGIAIGTQALFQEGVAFARLALAIVDEQHRFGVHQRLQLREKGRSDDRYPHQLVMTATPIPRTLAMTAYADLDVSIIDELPPGRTPIKTVVLPDSRRSEVVERIEAACRAGRQAYWVCPLIEESELVQYEAAETTAAQLAEALPDVRIGLVHGRMPGRRKDATMTAFKHGKLDLLVATTVIEVGVDVPNASLMVIENAERIGLAQLHQLRGRVRVFISRCS